MDLKLMLSLLLLLLFFRLANFGQGCVTTAEQMYASARMISNEISGCFQTALMSSAARLPQQLIRDRSRTDNSNSNHISRDNQTKSSDPLSDTNSHDGSEIECHDDGSEKVHLVAPLPTVQHAMSRNSSMAKDNNALAEGIGNHQSVEGGSDSFRNNFIHFPSLQQEDE